jgi:hypothetical protein
LSKIVGTSRLKNNRSKLARSLHLRVPAESIRQASGGRRIAIAKRNLPNRQKRTRWIRSEWFSIAMTPPLDAPLSLAQIDALVRGLTAGRVRARTQGDQIHLHCEEERATVHLLPYQRTEWEVRRVLEENRLWPKL